MSADPRARAVALANKLLALAAPTSGTTQAEQDSAAQKALKVILDNGLVTAIPEAPTRRKRKPASRTQTAQPVYSPPVYYPGSNWTEVYVATPCLCVVCSTTIFAGDYAWFDSSQGYRHYDITCDSV